MGLTETFQNGAKTTFNAFGDIVKDCTYIDIVDDGFDKTQTEYLCTVIPVSNLEEEQNTVSFREIVQPNDIIALIPGIDLAVEIKINSKLRFTPIGSTEKTFTIIDKNVDPAGALYILLLRKL